MEPALPGCGGGVLDGGDTGESFLAAAGSSSTASSGVGTMVGAAGVDVSTLLGPEGTSHLAVVAGVGVSSGSHDGSHALVTGPRPDGCWPHVVGVGVRSLRIA
jgi:hypothetical protein